MATGKRIKKKKEGAWEQQKRNMAHKQGLCSTGQSATKLTDAVILAPHCSLQSIGSSMKDI